MTDVILCYITCESSDQAEKIATHLMDRKLCACVNIFPEMKPMFFWPPKSGKIEDGNEVVLIAKTIASKYSQLEAEVGKIHSYKIPCIFAIPVVSVSKKYYDWLLGEME